MSGPIPKPTAILKLAGGWRSKLRKAEPKPAVTAPKIPLWLDVSAKETWMQMMPLLQRMRVVTEADGYALSVLCETWSRYLRATEMLKQFGDVYPVKNLDGTLKLFRRSPYSSMQMELALSVRKMLGEFGLTPSARGRMIALPEDTTHGKAQYFAVKKSG